MSKAARVVAAVIVTVAAIVTLNPQLAQAAIALDASVIAGALAPKLPRVSSGSETRWTADPRIGVPYAVGRCALAGDRRFERSAGSVNKFKNAISVYTVGPISAYEEFLANNAAVSFTADGGEGASGYYLNRMWMKRQYGVAHEPYLHWTATGSKDTPANHGGMPTQWTWAHGMSGYAGCLWGAEWDPAKFAGGVLPPPLQVGKWVLVYDPRLDSTYPGGTGPCRYADPSDKAAYLAAKATWVWSADPNLHGLQWALGAWTGDPDYPDMPLVQTHGLGLEIEDVDVAGFVEAANVSLANGWTIGGRVYSTDDPWEVLKSFLQAGGAEPILLGDRLSCLVNTPKVSVATLRGPDAIGEVSLDAAVPFNERINTVWPSWTVAELNWEVTPAPAPIQVSAYVVDDQGVRSKELSLPLVQNPVHAGQITRYWIEDSRELGNIVIPVPPKWGMWLEPGMCITADEPEWCLNGQKLIIRKRVFDPASMVDILICRTETDGKHAFALGTTATPPDTPALTGIDPNIVPLPAGDAWAVVGGVVGGVGGSLPGIVIDGEADLYDAVSIVVDYRQIIVPTEEWGPWRSQTFPASARTLVVTGVKPGATYQVRVRYITAKGVENPGANVDLGEVTVGGVDAGTLNGKTAAEVVDDAEDLLGPAITAAQDDATEALNALFDPTSGALHEISLLQDQDALFTSDIAVLDADLTTAVGRIETAEARQRSLPNLIRNGNGADPQALHYWTAPSGGFSVAVGMQLGSYFAAAANSSGVTRYLYSDVYPTAPGNLLSLSLSGNPGANTGAARAFVFFKWCRNGTPLGDSATIVLDATTIDFLDKRAVLEGVTVPATVATQVPNGYQVVYAAPNTHAVSTFSRIMVNYGAVAVPFNDQATAGDTLARVRTTEIAQAATDSAVAALDNRVGVSMQQGSAYNANAYIGGYTASTGAPDGWAIVTGGAFTGVAADFTRQTGRGANYAVRTAPGAGISRGLFETLTLTAGDYVLRLEGKLNSGDWDGAGLFLSNGTANFYLPAGSETDNAGGSGVGAVGIRSWSKKVTISTAGTYNLYAMFGWPGFPSGTTSAKSLDVWVAAIEPIDQPVRQALADASSALIATADLDSALALFQSDAEAHFDDLDAEASIQGTALTDVTDKVAAARLVLATAATGGKPTRFTLYSDNLGTGFIALEASEIYFGDNTVFDDATDTLTTVTGGVANVIAWGAAFGASGANLTQWIGDSSVALAAMTKANAYFYVSTDAPYVGGGAIGSTAAPANNGWSDTIPNSGGTETTVLSFAAPAAFPAGGKFKITAALTDGVGDGSNFSNFTLRIKIQYGATTTTLATAICNMSADVDSLIGDGALRSLSSTLIANPGSGAATIIVTRQRGGPTASGGGDYDGSLLVEWVNA